MSETESLQALIIAAGMSTAGGVIFEKSMQSEAHLKSSRMSAVNLREQLVNLVQILKRVTSSLSFS